MKNTINNTPSEKGITSRSIPDTTSRSGSEELKVRSVSVSGAGKNIAVKVSATAIFSALSLILSLTTTSVLPRVQWGLALFDPVSIVWILAMFFFGFEVGFATSVVGSFLLSFFDPFAPIGPLMKFAATVPLIIVPALGLKLAGKPATSEEFTKTSNLILGWLGGVIIRIALMLFLNYLILTTIFAGFFSAEDWDLSFIGLPAVKGWAAVYGTVIFINFLQSIWDYLFPAVITFTIKRSRPSLIKW